MSVLKEVMTFAWTWQPNVLIKEHPDRKANLDNPYSWLQKDFLTNYNRSDVNDEWQQTGSIWTWDLLFQWPFKFIFCLYRVFFLIIFLFMSETFVWQGSGKIPINFTRARNSPHMQENTKFFLQNKGTTALTWHTVPGVIKSLWSLKKKKIMRGITYTWLFSLS